MKNNKIQFINRITDVWDYPKLSIYNNEIDTEYFAFLKNPSNNNERGIRLYIHTPFCNSFCYFCQFYKEPHPKDSEFLDRYYSALLKELDYYSKSEYFSKINITSIFFGGGDPACVDIRHFTNVIEYILKNFNVSTDVSITMEGNIINLLDEEKIKIYKNSGVTRFSFGIQTFNEELRKKLLIKPTIKQTYQLVDLFNKLNITDYTFDLMYNFPDQTIDMVKTDLEAAIKLNPQYIDFFNLNMYPNTAFFDAVYKKNNFRIIPDKQREHDMLKLINNFMDENGYNQVLSVTYSKRETQPHIGLYNYLMGGEMLGIGPSARSFLNNKGYRNICSVKRYIEKINNNELPVETGSKLTEEQIETRNLILFPTLLEVSKERIATRPDVMEKIQTMIESGYINEVNNKYHISREGRLWIGNIQKYFYDNEYSKSDFKNFLTAIKNNKSAYNQDSMWVKEKND